MLISSWKIATPGRTGSRSVNPLRRQRAGLRIGSLRRGLTLVEMAIVLFIMGLMMAILISVYRRFSVLQTTEDEAKTLSQTYAFARRAALKSGETVYLDLNLDEEKYVLYRMDRTGEHPEKKPIFEERSLSRGNSLIAVVSPLGGRISSGLITLPFFYDGTTQEVSIYLGPDPLVEKTVHFPRFATAGIIEQGETLPESMPAVEGDQNLKEKELLEENSF